MSLAQIASQLVAIGHQLAAEASAQTTPAVNQTPKVFTPTVAVTSAQARTRDGRVHIQYRLSNQPGYRKADVAIPDSFHFPKGSQFSMAGGTNMYVPLTVVGGTLSYNGFVLFTVTEVGGGGGMAQATIAPAPTPAPKPAVPGTVLKAQVSMRGNAGHIQFTVAGQKGYRTADVPSLSWSQRSAIGGAAKLASMAGTGKSYAPLGVVNTEDGVELFLASGAPLTKVTL